MTSTHFFWKCDLDPTFFVRIHTLPEHPLKIGPGRNSVKNAAFHPLHVSRLLARSNPSAAHQASTSGARARGFCPLLWSRGPRPSNGLWLRTALGVCGREIESFTANGVSGTLCNPHPSHAIQAWVWCMPRKSVSYIFQRLGSYVLANDCNSRWDGE